MRGVALFLDLRFYWEIVLRLVLMGILYTLTTITVFFSYGVETATERWRQLISPTPIQNKFLPVQVNAAISCLKKMGAKKYHLAGELKANALIYQRMAEGAWPIEMHENSTVIVAAKPQDADCSSLNIVCAEGDIIVGICTL